MGFRQLPAEAEVYNGQGTTGDLLGVRGGSGGHEGLIRHTAAIPVDRYQFKALLVVRIVSLVRRPESISH
jgi:hypothetical protein